MPDYRHRPHDHLVEPLFGGLQGAEAKPDESSRRGWAPLAILLASLAVAAGLWLAL